MRGSWPITLVGAALLVGCASPIVEDDLQGKLARYYAAHAIEEDGACPSPEISTVTRRKVIESGGNRTVLRVRYGYFDPSVEDEADWPRVLITDRPCTGFAERDFTLEERRTGYAVMDMSGPRRAGE